MEPGNFKHFEISDVILKGFYEVYNELRFGFLEAIYEKAMVIVLREKGLDIATQGEIPVFFRGQQIGNYVADVLVEGKIILELKACKALLPAHEAQLMHYLRATQIEVGLLLNFGPRPEFKRLAFDNQRKRSG